MILRMHFEISERFREKEEKFPSCIRPGGGLGVALEMGAKLHQPVNYKLQPTVNDNDDNSYKSFPSYIQWKAAGLGRTAIAYSQLQNKVPTCL